MKETFIVMAHRAASSVFGAMDSTCKDGDGETITFDSRAGAEAYRESLEKNLTTSNVSYTVKAMYE
jgi:hypothetical protein